MLLLMLQLLLMLLLLLALGFCLNMARRDGFPRVLQSSACQVDKYMGWPDRSLSLSVSALTSLAAGVGFHSSGSPLNDGRLHRPLGDVCRDEAIRLRWHGPVTGGPLARQPPTWLPIHRRLDAMTLIWLQSVKGLICYRPVATKNRK